MIYKKGCLFLSFLLLTLSAAGPTRRLELARAGAAHGQGISETFWTPTSTTGATTSANAAGEGQRVHTNQKASSTQADAGTESRQPREAAVLSLIRFPWKKLGYEVAFLGPRPGYRAMTIVEKRRIEIYMRPGESELVQAYDLAHELGHAFDLEYNNSERRRRWLQLRGIDPSTPWFGCDRCPDYSTPAGDFAETFALLVLGPGNYHSHLAQAPTSAQIPELAAFCQAEIPDAGGLQATAGAEDESSQ